MRYPLYGCLPTHPYSHLRKTPEVHMRMLEAQSPYHLLFFANMQNAYSQ
jgi:hypothetical protein